MATRTRKLDIVIGSEAKGSGFKDTDRDLDKLGEKLRRFGKESGEQSGDGFMSGFQSKLTEKSKGFGSFLKGVLGKEFELSALTIGTGFSAQLIGSIAAGLASGAAKVAHGAAAIGALLPAAIGAGVLAFATLKLAVSGVGDALSAGLAGDTEAFDEALKKLSPSAQEFARSVAGMKGELDGLKSAVQESFFAPWVEAVRPLAETYLPIIEGRLTAISGAFGSAVADIAGWLQLPEVSSSIAAAMDAMSEAVANVVAGLPNLVAAFLPLISVGSQFLPGLTHGFSDLTGKVRDFMVEAEQTGRLHDFISGGLSALGDLWETLQQVGNILGNIGSIAGQFFGGITLQGGNLLDTIERLTERAAAFFDTAQGGQVVSEVLGTVGSIAGNLLGTLQRVAGMLARAFGPVLPELGKFVEAFFRLKAAFQDIALDALEPVLNAIGSVLGDVVLPALTGLADLLARNRPVLQGIAIAIGTLLVPGIVAWGISAGIAAVNTLLMMAPLLLLGAVIAGFAALVIIHFDTIKSVISAVWNWVKDNWQLLLIILTGPIGAAVALIVAHWDTIWNAIKTVWDLIVAHWSLMFDIFTAPISAAVGFITGAWDSVVSFVTGLPGRISEAASGMWDGIKDAFKSVINTIIGWWNGISFKLPTISIPGFDPPGPGPKFGGFDIGGQTFSTPDISPLAEGGVVPATPGGILARVGEGRHDEAVIPLDGHHGVGGDTYIIENHFHGPMGGKEIVASINDALREGHAIRDRGRRM